MLSQQMHTTRPNRVSRSHRQDGAPGRPGTLSAHLGRSGPSKAFDLPQAAGQAILDRPRHQGKTPRHERRRRSVEECLDRDHGKEGAGIAEVGQLVVRRFSPFEINPITHGMVDAPVGCAGLVLRRYAVGDGVPSLVDIVDDAVGDQDDRRAAAVYPVRVLMIVDVEVVVESRRADPGDEIGRQQEAAIGRELDGAGFARRRDVLDLA